MESGSRLTIDGSFVIAKEPTFVARFVLGPSEIEVVDNVDVFVDLPDGSSWALTIFTVDEVRRLLQHWEATGEVAHGSYFWAVDQLIVPRPGIAAMVAAIRELVRSNELTQVGVPSDENGRATQT